MLLGYRRDRAVLVTSVVVLYDDPSATPSSYTGRGRAIQHALNHILPTLPDGTGYVGPWHASSSAGRPLEEIAEQWEGLQGSTPNRSRRWSQ